MSEKEDVCYCTMCFCKIEDGKEIFDVNGDPYCSDEHYEESKENE